MTTTPLEDLVQRAHELLHQAETTDQTDMVPLLVQASSAHSLLGILIHLTQINPEQDDPETCTDHPSQTTNDKASSGSKNTNEDS